MKALDLIVRGARVVTCDGPPADPLGILEGAAIGVRDGKVAFLGRSEDLPGALLAGAVVHEAEGRLLLPGLVDPHTHLVFGGDRIGEFSRKMAGVPYATIAKEGGGIVSTVRATRALDEEGLFSRARSRALAMREHGTTAAEVKSGYGLSLKSELSMLRVGRRLAKEGILRTSTSLLGAHAIPPEFKENRTGYVDLVAERMVPEAAAAGLADACDVYLDEGAFTREEATRILEAARSAGLSLRLHAGQFADLGGAELAASLGALSADHLEQVSDAGLTAMARSGTVAVLLPGAWRTLRQTPPDAARMRAHGVAVAIGTDCNPGTSPMTDLPLCAALAVRDAGVTPSEALLGITEVAARAAGLNGAGRLRIGGDADFSLYEADDPQVLVYALGGLRASAVSLGGRWVLGPRELPRSW